MTPCHSLFRCLVSCLLAVLVLTASVGLTVQRYTCRMSGRSTVDLSVTGQLPQRDCAGQVVNNRPLAKDNCCDLSRHLHKLSAPAHELAPKALVPVPLLALSSIPKVWASAPPAVAVAVGTPLWFAADASPPPMGGRDLLTFVCTLLV